MNLADQSFGLLKRSEIQIVVELVKGLPESLLRTAPGNAQNLTRKIEHRCSTDERLVHACLRLAEAGDWEPIAAAAWLLNARN